MWTNSAILQKERLILTLLTVLAMYGQMGQFYSMESED
jgi:hypothetical protein